MSGWKVGLGKGKSKNNIDYRWNIFVSHRWRSQNYFKRLECPCTTWEMFESNHKDSMKIEENVIYN